MNNDVLKYAIVGVGAAGSGFGIGVLVTRKRAEKRANEEIASVKATYALVRQEKPPLIGPEEVVRNSETEIVEEIMQAHGYIPTQETFERETPNDEEIEVEAEEDDPSEDVRDFMEEIEEEIREAVEEEPVGEVPQDDRTVIRNIFDEALLRAQKSASVHSTEEFDELRSRDAAGPFRISTDAFMDDENEFAKITITYYEGDHTLTDEREQIIPDIEGVVGQENLYHFGEDSDSLHTVYVRNEKLRTDFEIVREEGSYTTVVLGVRDYKDPTPRIRKMRDDD